MEQQDTFVQEPEYIAGEEVPEVETDLAPIPFPVPMEQFKNLFDRMAGIRTLVIQWEEKTIITNAKTRDEAIRLRTSVTRTAKAIEDAYLAATEPLRKGITEARELATNAQIALIGTNKDKALGVAGRLTTKISNFAAEEKAAAERMKQEALRKQRLVEDELAAYEEMARWQEQQKQLEEDRALEQFRAEALAKSQSEGHAEGEVDTTELDADLAMAEAQAKIDADRAVRDAAQKAQELVNQEIKDKAQRDTLNTLAVATAKANVKGVKTVWVIELVDEEILDKKYMVFEPAKARKMLEAGMYDKKEKDPEKLIPGLRCVAALGKGGK